MSARPKGVTLLDHFAVELPLTAAELKHIREFRLDQQHEVEAVLRFEKAQAMMRERDKLQKAGVVFN